MMGKWASKARKNYDVPAGDKQKPSRFRHVKLSDSLGDNEMNNKAEKVSNGIGMFHISQVHTDAIASIDALEPSLCISGSKDGTIVVQDLSNGKIVQRWSEHTKEVAKVRCSYRSVASTSRDLSVKTWNMDNNESKATLLGHKLIVTAVDFNGDNTCVVTGSRDNFVKLWDIETEQCTTENSISRNLVTDIKWVKGENLIVQTSEDKMLKLWDTRSLQVCHSFPIQAQIHTCCDVNGLYCLTGCNGFGGQGCQIHLWDLRQRVKLQEYKGHTETVSDCAFTNGFQTFASCSHDGTVRLWQQHKSQQISCEQLNIGTLTSITALNRNTLLCGSFYNGLSIVEVNDEGKLTLAV